MQNKKTITKPNPTYLTKTYVGNEVPTLVAELALIDRNIANIFFSKFNAKDTPKVEQVLELSTTLYDGEHQVLVSELTYDDLPIIIGSYMSNYYSPQLLRKQNVHTAWFISSNKITVRSDRGFTLSIDAAYTIVDKKDGEETRKVAEINTLTVVVSSFKSNQYVIDTAEKLGYVKTEPKTRRSNAAISKEADE